MEDCSTILLSFSYWRRHGRNGRLGKLGRHGRHGVHTGRMSAIALIIWARFSDVGIYHQPLSAEFFRKQRVTSLHRPVCANLDQLGVCLRNIQNAAFPSARMIFFVGIFVITLPVMNVYLEFFRCTAFRVFVVGNDIFMIGIPWVISPTFTTVPRYAQIMPSPWFLTTIYSIFEPLATIALLYIGAHPESVFKGILPWHLINVLFTVESIFNTLGLVVPWPPEEEKDKSSTLEEGIPEDKSEPILTSQDSTPMSVSQQARVHCMYVLPLFTSALMSAAILLWTAGVNPEETLLPFLEDLRVLEPMYILGVYFIVDWALSARCTARAWYLGEKVGKSSPTGTQIGCLLLSLATRFAMRILLGIDPWLALHPMDERVWQGMKRPELVNFVLALDKGRFASILIGPLSHAPPLLLAVFKYWAIRRNERRRIVLESQNELSECNDKSSIEQRHREEKKHLPKCTQVDKQPLYKYLEDPFVLMAITSITPSIIFSPIFIGLLVYWLRQRSRAKKTALVEKREAQLPKVGQ